MGREGTCRIGDDDVGEYRCGGGYCLFRLFSTLKHPSQTKQISVRSPPQRSESDSSPTHLLDVVGGDVARAVRPAGLDEEPAVLRGAEGVQEVVFGDCELARGDGVVGVLGFHSGCGFGLSPGVCAQASVGVVRTRTRGGMGGCGGWEATRGEVLVGVRDVEREGGRGRAWST